MRASHTVLSRRRLLAFGVTGSAWLGLGCSLRSLSRGYALPGGVPAPVALTVKELLVVRAIVDALYPADGAFPAGTSVGVPARIDEEIYSQTPELRADLKDAIELIEHAPPLVGRFGRFTQLAAVERAEVLTALRTRGPDVVVQCAVALGQMAGAFYFGRPETWAAIGYDGPWQQMPMPPPSARRYQRTLEKQAAESSR